MHPKKQNTATGSNAGLFGSRLLLRPSVAPPPPTATTRNLLRLMKETGIKKKDPIRKTTSLGADPLPVSSSTGVVDRVEKPKVVIRCSMDVVSKKKPANVDIFGAVPTKLLAELKPRKVIDRNVPISKKRKLRCMNPDTPLNRTDLPVHGNSLYPTEPMDQSTDDVSALPTNLCIGLKRRKPFRIVQQHPVLTATKEFIQDELAPHPISSDIIREYVDHVHTEVATTTAETAPTRNVEAKSSRSVCINPYTNAASQSIPRPTTSKPATKPKDNYIRLNLRNKAGACFGARNVRDKSKSKLQWEQRRKDRLEHFEALQREEEDPDDDPSSGRTKLVGSTDAIVNQMIGKSTISVTSSFGVDVVDDFMDGVFAAESSEANPNAKKNAAKRVSPIPLCSGHQQPCKVLTVKKSGPNRGRQFYACACPRMEQCNHFAWADDTLRVSFSMLCLLTWIILQLV
jgi:GRF zinc finger